MSAGLEGTGGAGGAGAKGVRRGRQRRGAGALAHGVDCGCIRVEGWDAAGGEGDRARERGTERGREGPSEGERDRAKEREGGGERRREVKAGSAVHRARGEPQPVLPHHSSVSLTGHAMSGARSLANAELRGRRARKRACRHAFVLLIAPPYCPPYTSQ